MPKGSTIAGSRSGGDFDHGGDRMSDCACLWRPRTCSGYMLESERDLHPHIVPTPNDAAPAANRGWSTGPISAKRAMSVTIPPREAREMEDIKARLEAHGRARHRRPGALSDDFSPTRLPAGPEIELAVTRSYNRWLIDIWKQAPERLRWVAVLPLLSMDKAIEEARYAKENGACGIFMRGLEGDKHISDPHFFDLRRSRPARSADHACIPRPAASPCMIIFSMNAASTDSSSPWSGRSIR